MIGALLIGVVRFYLEALASLVDDGGHLRRESRLLMGSIDYLYQFYRQEGASAGRSLLRALWDHVGELQPVALYQKVRADAAATAELRAEKPLLKLSYALVFALLTVLVCLAVAILTMLLVLWPSQAERKK